MSWMDRMEFFTGICRSWNGSKWPCISRMHINLTAVRSRWWWVPVPAVGWLTRNLCCLFSTLKLHVSPVSSKHNELLNIHIVIPPPSGQWGYRGYVIETSCISTYFQNLYTGMKMWILMIPSITNNKYPNMPQMNQWYFLTTLEGSAEFADIFSCSSSMKWWNRNSKPAPNGREYTY